MSRAPVTVRSMRHGDEAPPQAARAPAHVGKTPLMRARDLAEAGIARETRRRLVQRGEPEQPERRLYRRVGGPMAAEASIAEVAHRTPHAVMAFLSALRFHGLTTHCPQEVRVCIDRRARFCVRPPVRLRVFRVGGEGLRLGVETHVIEGMSVKVTTAARTIVD